MASEKRSNDKSVLSLRPTKKLEVDDEVEISHPIDLNAADVQGKSIAAGVVVQGQTLQQQLFSVIPAYVSIGDYLPDFLAIVAIEKIFEVTCSHSSHEKSARFGLSNISANSAQTLIKHLSVGHSGIRDGVLTRDRLTSENSLLVVLLNPVKGLGFLSCLLSE